MGLMLLIGWRNLWRNKRRSLIMLGALVIGLWGVVMIYGLNRSFIEGMVDLVITSHTAYIQIHHEGYQQDPDIGLTIKGPEKILDKVRNTEQVQTAAPRAKVISMISSARSSNGITFVGIDPEAEGRVTNLKQSMVKGEYLEAGDESKILIGEGLAEKLRVKLGSKVVIYARDPDRELKVLGLRVQGIYSTGAQNVDKYMAFVPLRYFQKELGLERGVHEIAITIEEARELQGAKQALVNSLSGAPGLEVLTWREMYAFLDQIFQMSAISNYFMLGIVLIAIALGIANTMVMSVFERFREIGIMKAIGTRQIQVFYIVVIESLSMAITGLIIGSLLSLATLWVWNYYGIDLSMYSASLSAYNMPTVYYPKVYWQDWAVTWGAVLFIAVLSGLYPAVKAARKNPVEAIRM